MINMIRFIKQLSGGVDLIAGNVVSCAQAKNLCDAGVDAIKVGMGASSVSVASTVSAVGRPQATAVFHIAKFVHEHYNGQIPVIADGGHNNSGQVMKALCLGASVVMCGSLLAGSEQAPGSYFYHDGIRVKAFRGKASHRGNSANAVEGKQSVNVGVSGAVVDKGDVLKLCGYIMQGVKHGMQDLGVKTMPELHAGLRNGYVRIEVRSGCAQKEGKVHDLTRIGSGASVNFKRTLGMA